MKLILITGLDGSGKSTLLSRLEEVPDQDHCSFLRVPVIDVEKYKDNKEVYQASLFINRLNEYADNFNFPPLKVCALFASMIIFKELFKELKNKNCSVVFCERHPLIDTGVYARFYADKMNPNTIPKSIIDQLEIQYPAELTYLLNLIHITELDVKNGRLYTFVNYIYNWFFVDKKFGLVELKKLFEIDLPDKIFYLKADPEILMERLSGRKILEAHESKIAFEQLIPFYDKVLIDSGVEVELVSANTIENLNATFEKLKSTYFFKDL